MIVTIISSPIPKPLFFSSPFSPHSPTLLSSLSFSLRPSRSHRRQLAHLTSMALPSSSSPPLMGSSNDAELETQNPSVVGENDLLIVGPGVLGRMVAEKWRQDHPDSQIYGQTMTSDHHDELVRVGIKPTLRGTKTDNQFPYVIFCAPPSRTEDYQGDVSLTNWTTLCMGRRPPVHGSLFPHYDMKITKSNMDCPWSVSFVIIMTPVRVRLAAANWSGEGSFLLTSSTAVYDCNDNGLCDEDSPIVPIGRSPRTDVLLRAENAVLEVGGCVLRLAGLYKMDRGAHVYWLEKGTIPYRPDHILNLIHYEDAASLAIAIMKKKLRGRTFLGCDNHPLSRQEVMDCVKQSGKFSKEFQAFTGKDDPLGKRMNNLKTREEIEWEPKYASFSHFLGLTE